MTIGEDQHYLEFNYDSLDDNSNSSDNDDDDYSRPTLMQLGQTIDTLHNITRFYLQNDDITRRLFYYIMTLIDQIMGELYP